MLATEYFLKFKKNLVSVYDLSEIDAIFNLLLDYLSLLNSINNKTVYLTEEHLNFLDKALIRLVKNEPVQHITEKAYFYKNWFKVNKNVLIPRSETEELVHLILELKTNSLNFLEIGLGSGCIAISLLKEKPNWKATGFEISEEALDIANFNAKDLQVLHNSKFLLQNTFNDFLIKNIDFIVSNPPYIALSEAQTMHKNVLDFEPHIALFSSNPLAFYERIAQIAFSNNMAIPCYLEINPLFSKEILSLFKGHKLVEDMHKKMRFLIPQKSH